MIRRRTQRQTAPGGPDRSRAIDFGWRVHAAQEAWTAKVDVKASIVLALDGALLAAIIGGHNNDGVFADLTGWRNVVHGISAILVFIALVLAAAAVIPLLGRSSSHERDHAQHLIYFGHLRHWDPNSLAVRLQGLTQTAETEQLATQLVAMSKRNWRKHRFLQFAICLTATSVLLLALAALWPHFQC